MDHNIGRLQSVSASASASSYVEAYTYDAKGRLATRSITIPSDATHVYDLAYNNKGLPDTLTYPESTTAHDRLKLKYTYQSGLLQNVKDANAGTVFWQANTMNFRGQVTQETLGNNLVTARAFDDVTGFPAYLHTGRACQDFCV